MSKVVIKAPASTANLGSGFDTMGIALSLYNTVELEPADRLIVVDLDSAGVPNDERNLVWRTVKRVYDECGKPLAGLKIAQRSPIFQARGLGSSSACIAAGVAGASKLLPGVLSVQDALEIACRMEGHPDNVAPALLGGFVTSVMDGDRVYTVKQTLPDSLRFAAFVPDFPLLTSKARAALPAQVPHKDAVYNVSRAAMMAAAFCTGQYELLGQGCQDRLHQPYRIGLIPGGQTLLNRLPALGARAVFISGAGPTMLAIVEAENTQFEEKARQLLSETEETRRFALHMLAAHNESMI